MVRYGFLLSVIAVWLAPAQEQTKPQYLPPEAIQRRLGAVPGKAAERGPVLERLFREAGCGGARLTHTKVAGSKDPDIVCTLAGSGPEQIIVGGHFDRANAGMGVVDDWSGSALLPSLFETLKTAPRRHTIVFVGFAAEEKGLFGSRSYVHGLSRDERSAIRAMVNLECLGLTPPKVWASRANQNLLDAFWKVAFALNLPRTAVNVDRVGDDDSHPFLNAGIPVITIHSLTQQTLRILHSSRDNLEAIDAMDYYKAYKLAATYVNYLDETLQ